jgi:hypothetical protein
MKSLKLVALLLIAISLLSPLTVFNHETVTNSRTIRLKICLEELESIVEIVEPIEVGCEVIDCCPSCPLPPWNIAWDVKVIDRVFDDITLIPVNLRRETRDLKLSGFDLIPSKEKFAGALRMKGDSGSIEGLLHEKPGKSGALRPVAKFRKGTPEGSYRIEITQRLVGTTTIIRTDRIQFDVKSCLPDPTIPACEANSITPRLLQHAYGKHSPIYPREGESVTYTASGRGKTAEGIGVRELSVEVQQFQLTSIQLFGINVMIPTFVRSFTDSETFPDAPMDAEMTLGVKPFPRNTLVVYKAEAELADGTTLSDSKITHAANLNSDAIDFFRGAVPVYVRGAHKDKFDFLFAPDTDYEDNEGAYISDLEDQLFNRMFTDPPYRWKRFRRYMNVYMNMLRPGLTGDVEGLSEPEFLVDEPDNFDGEGSDLPWVDVAVVLHQSAFQDWAFLGLMEGKFCTAEAGTDVVNMEALHALMFLKDEYAGDRTQPPIEHPNVFDSQEDCEKHVATHPGFDVGHCEKGPGESSFWHWCHSYMESQGVPIHVMDTNGTGPFAVEERCQLAWAVDNLLGSPEGSAYGPMWVYGCAGFPCARTAKATGEVDKSQLAEEEVITEKISERDLMIQEVQGDTLALALRLRAGRAALVGASVQRGVPSNLGAAFLYKGREREAPFRLQFFKGKRLVKEIGLSDPRLLSDTTVGGKARLIDDIRWSIRLPFKDLSKATRLKVIDKSQRVFLDSRLAVTR